MTKKQGSDPVKQHRKQCLYVHFEFGNLPDGN